MSVESRTSETEVCTWVEQDPDYGYWQACGDNAFSLEGGRDGFKFCLYCGKSLLFVPFVYPKDEDDE